MKTLRYFSNAMWFFMGMDVALIAVHTENRNPFGIALAVIGFVGCGASALFINQVMAEIKESKC